MDKFREDLLKNKKQILQMRIVKDLKAQPCDKVQNADKCETLDYVLAPESTNMKYEGLSLQMREYFYSKLKLSLLNNLKTCIKKKEVNILETDYSNISRKTARTIEYNILCDSKSAFEYKYLATEKISNFVKSTSRYQLCNVIMNTTDKSSDKLRKTVDNSNVIINHSSFNCSSLVSHDECKITQSKDTNHTVISISNSQISHSNSLTDYSLDDSDVSISSIMNNSTKNAKLKNSNEFSIKTRYHSKEKIDENRKFFKHKKCSLCKSDSTINPSVRVIEKNKIKNSSIENTLQSQIACCNDLTNDPESITDCSNLSGNVTESMKFDTNKQLKNNTNRKGNKISEKKEDLSKSITNSNVVIKQTKSTYEKNLKNRISFADAFVLLKKIDIDSQKICNVNDLNIEKNVEQKIGEKNNVKSIMNKRLENKMTYSGSASSNKAETNIDGRITSKIAICNILKSVFKKYYKGPLIANRSHYKNIFQKIYDDIKKNDIHDQKSIIEYTSSIIESKKYMND